MSESIGKASLNNRLILSVHKTDGAIKSSERNGLAFIQQKVAVVGLKVLMNAHLSDGSIIPEGSTAHIKEELLQTQPWAKKILESEALSEKFIIVDLNNVEFVTP